MKQTVSLLMLCLFIAGCGAGNVKEASKAQAETIDMQFQPVEIKELVEKKPQKSWKQMKSLPFGTFSGKTVTLTIFHKPGQPDPLPSPLHGFIEIQGKSYMISDDLSNALLQEQGDLQDSYFLLQRQFPSTDRPIYLLGCVELFANGPGRMAYLAYDSTREKWLTFEEWGFPAFLDLDADGEDEFLIEFPGLHLQLPNVKVIALSPEQQLLAATVVPPLQSQEHQIFAYLNKKTSPPAICVGAVNQEKSPAAYPLSTEKTGEVRFERAMQISSFFDTMQNNQADFYDRNGALDEILCQQKGVQ